MLNYLEIQYIGKTSTSLQVWGRWSQTLLNRFKVWHICRYKDLHGGTAVSSVQSHQADVGFQSPLRLHAWVFCRHSTFLQSRHSCWVYWFL